MSSSLSWRNAAQSEAILVGEGWSGVATACLIISTPSGERRNALIMVRTSSSLMGGGAVVIGGLKIKNGTMVGISFEVWVKSCSEMEKKN